jgi:hypothetical protein
MEDIKKIQEFFSKPLNEEKEPLDIIDLAKVVKAVQQTGHPVTVLLVPKFNEIEVLTGMNAPDDMLRDLSNAVDSLGYGRNDIIIAGDSSNLSRREYSDIRRVNGGAKDYFEEAIAENDSYARVSKPRFVKDKNNPNFLNVYIDYDLGLGGSSIALGKETMTGQIRRATAIKAKELAFDVARDLKTKYNLEDIDVQDLENGKIHIFAVSDDFIDMDPNMLSEAKKETGVDMAKKQLDALGVKYEMSKTDKVRPFKVIYKPINKEDDWYDKFEEIVDLFNLKGFVKQSMNEANGFKSGKEFINIKLQKYPKAVAKVNQLIDIIGEDKFTMEMAEWIFDFFNNAHFESPMNEATKDEETTFHKKLDKLVHDTFGKRKGELEEAYVPSNIAEFAKRRGVSSLVRKVAGWAEKVGARITGGTAIGKGYNTLILDMGYQTADIRIDVEDETIELYDEPIYSFNDFKRVFMEEESRKQAEHDEETLRREQGLEEKAAYIAETIKLGLMLNEELCEKGQRYIKARQAAGEKSSAYLSGRAVRVCKGQIEWPKKGKKKK